MQAIAANPDELNNFVIRNDGPFQQSAAWGDLQLQMHRHVVRQFFLDGQETVFSGSFVRHDLKFGKYYWLCTRGPVFSKNFQFSNLNFREFLRRHGGIFVRIEPEIFADHESALREAGFKKAPKDHSPKATILINLTQAEDALLAQMHPKTRYNTKLAQKKEVQVKFPISNDQFPMIWELFVKTAEKNKFQLHPKKYYQLMAGIGEVKLCGAYFGDKLLAAAMISVFAGKAIYLHGASDYENRAFMAPYLLHWQIMRALKAEGVNTYDLGGVAPEGDTAHPLAKLNRFKSGFAGQYVEYVGSWDYVASPMWYGIYKLARRFL